jgi:hypothetical protein
VAEFFDLGKQEMEAEIMEATIRTVIMRRDPLEGNISSRQLSLTCMLMICVYHELYSKELDLIFKLSGRTFRIELINSMDNFQKMEDFLIFEEDKISNTNNYFPLRQELYTVTEKDGGVRFEAESINEDEGVRIWKGAVEGRSIEGVMVCAKIGRPVESYTFKGSMV